jgi:hypothetical protein
MRLLELKENGEFSLTVFSDNIPPYTILSHTWGADSDEVTFKDLEEDTGKSKAGYDKIRFCGKQAAQNGLRYFWVDTCCINKSDYTELNEAIFFQLNFRRNLAGQLMTKWRNARRWEV